MLLTCEMKNTFSVYELLGSIASIGAAALSGYFAYLSYRQARKVSDRGINVEGTRMLLEIDRCLIEDPKLWACIDDHPVRNAEEFKNVKNAPIFQAKLEAFSYLIINTFEMVLAETLNARDCADRNTSQLWKNFFTDTISKSTLMRNILEREEAAATLHPNLLALYKNWSESHQPISTE